MGAFVGALAGVGLLLLWHGCTRRPRAPRPRARTERMREELAQAGLSGVSPRQLVVLQVLAGVLVAVAALVVTVSVSVSVIFGLFAAAGPRLLVSRLRRRRQSDLRELWPEVVDNLTSGVRAGLSLPEALAAVGVRGPQQLRAAFAQFGTDYRVTGRFDLCLDRLKDALADPVGDRVCESLRVAREVGGTDLGRLLTTLSAFLREDARTRAELLARQSWSVNAARMAVAAPWLVLVLLATQRETLSAYDTPTGTSILVVGAVLSVAAYRLMVRIGRLPEDRRVLR
ncbi:type II secretion system F family protein [Nakamurella endophytica]|uniref:Type II secretion system protein F n=1 Tax=Nakamurella endophytica TaxID=1748367 RepID=A0A917T2M7_9ACTN|nr:type II secretion system F family protein [Nakamurella endophytica]GGM07769.1 type II secretion system protein F [Nakamurella endophytica]